jgi:hypothetical protein
MQPIRLFFEDAPETIPVPPELHHKRILVIFRPLNGAVTKTDSKNWPAGFIEETAGSIPALPERESQGDYEEREPLE